VVRKGPILPGALAQKAGKVSVIQGKKEKSSQPAMNL